MEAVKYVGRRVKHTCVHAVRNAVNPAFYKSYYYNINDAMYELYDSLRKSYAKLTERLKLKKKKKRKRKKSESPVYEFNDLYDWTYYTEDIQPCWIQSEMFEDEILPNLRRLALNESHPLWIAVLHGDVVSLRMLLDKRVVDLDARFECETRNYRTLLQHAVASIQHRKYAYNATKNRYECDCFANYGKCVDLLMDNGADVEGVDDDGSNVMHYLVESCCSCSVHFADLLYRREVKLDGLNRFGKTPLYLAMCNADLQMVSWLLDHGADVATLNNCPKFNRYELGRIFRNEQLVYDLLARGVLKVNEKFFQTCLPLRAAILSEREETIHMILDFGAGLDTQLCVDQTWSINNGYYFLNDKVVYRYSEDLVKLFVKELKLIQEETKSIARIPDKVQEFSGKCAGELSKLKQTHVYGNITAYKLLMANRNRFWRYSTIPEVEKWFARENLKIRYPIYGSRLHDRYKNNRRMISAIEYRVYSAFEDVLPNLVVRRIAKFARIAEMRDDDDFFSQRRCYQNYLPSRDTLRFFPLD